MSYAVPNTHVSSQMSIVPNTWDMLYCRPDYGQWKEIDIAPCTAALNLMPDEVGRKKFKREGFIASSRTSPYRDAIGMPLVYKADDCTITVDLDGSNRVLDEEWSNYPNIKAVAANIVSSCVQSPAKIGGWGTLGVFAAYDSMLPGNRNPPSPRSGQRCMPIRTNERRF